MVGAAPGHNGRVRRGAATVSLAFGLMSILQGCAASPPPPAPLTVTSPDIGGGTFPRELTCDGANRPPSFAWSTPDASTLSIVVELIDRDTPDPGYTHWIMYADTLGSGTYPAPDPNLFQQGMNQTGNLGYAGPCPPRGQTHHYRLIVRAVSLPMAPVAGGGGLRPGFNRAQLEAAMNSGHGLIVNQGELDATYTRP